MSNKSIIVIYLLIMLLLIMTAIVPFFVYSLANSNDNNPLNTFRDLFNTFKKNVFNLTKSLEYNIEIDSNQVFPNETIKTFILDKKEPLEYIIPIMKYNLLEFQIFAINIKVVTDPRQINIEGKNKTRLDFPIMNASNVRVNNSMINLAFDNVDMSSRYVIYDPEKDKLSIYVPIYVAARYLTN